MKSKKLINGELKVINIGTIIFAQALAKQGVKVVHLDWRPPVSGDTKLFKLLEKLRKK